MGTTLGVESLLPGEEINRGYSLRDSGKKRPEKKFLGEKNLQRVSLEGESNEKAGHGLHRKRSLANRERGWKKPIHEVKTANPQKQKEKVRPGGKNIDKGFLQLGCSSGKGGIKEGITYWGIRCFSSKLQERGLASHQKKEKGVAAGKKMTTCAAGTRSTGGTGGKRTNVIGENGGKRGGEEGEMWVSTTILTKGRMGEKKGPGMAKKKKVSSIRQRGRQTSSESNRRKKKEERGKIAPPKNGRKTGVTFLKKRAHTAREG